MLLLSLFIGLLQVSSGDVVEKENVGMMNDDNKAPRILKSRMKTEVQSIIFYEKIVAARWLGK
jgi:hypothetical protein